MPFTIREYRPTDASTTMGVFRAAIIGLASADYDEQQIQAWANHTGTMSQWNKRRISAHTWIAETTDAHTPVGFIDVDSTGYIDMLFIDPAYARQGVATLLLGMVMQFAEAQDMPYLVVHSSITARPFFAKHGFHVTRTHHPAIGDVAFTNYRMIRSLSSSSADAGSGTNILRCYIGQ